MTDRSLLLDKLIRTIGQGTFGKVVSGYDTHKYDIDEHYNCIIVLLSWSIWFYSRNDKKVAIKIVRKDKADYEDAVLEAKIIQQLQNTNSGPEK